MHNYVVCIIEVHMCTLICYNIIIVLDDSKGVSSGGVIQNYEDLVRNYVVSGCSLWVGKFVMHLLSLVPKKIGTSPLASA